jgi:ArsR family transcriptional regulator
MTATNLADRTAALQVFHALSDPVRLDVIELLGSGERCVCELTATLDVAQSRLSFHLRVLKDAGLVFDEAASLITELRPHGRYRSLPVSNCCN